MSENCIFCKIAKKEIPSEFLYEDELVFVIKDLNPRATTHLLVIPKQHYADLNNVDDKEMLAGLLQGVKNVTKKLGITDYKTIINTGKGAGQEVFHIHIHVLSGKFY